MIRAVLDTNTIVSAIINTDNSVSQEIYQNSKDKRFLLVISPSILAEVEDVIHRARLMRFHKYSALELKRIAKELTNVSLIVPGKIEIEVVRDPDDNKIISAALEGKADYIISRDRDLLDLKEYKGIKIVTPEKFMGILRTKKQIKV